MTKSALLTASSSANEPFSMFTAPSLTATEVQDSFYADDGQTLRGFKSGISGLGSAALASEALAQEQARDPAWRVTRDLALRQQEEAAAQGPRISSLRDIANTGDALDYAGGTIGQGVASMLPTLATALLTRGRGKLAAPTAFAGAALSGYKTQRDQAVVGQYQDPTLAAASAEDRDIAATGTGILGAGLEAAVPAGLAASMFRKPVTSFASNVARDTVGEAATETAQQLVSYGGEKYLDADRELDPWDLADAAVAGGLTGGAMSAAVRAPAHIAASAANAMPVKSPTEPGTPAAEPFVLEPDGGAPSGGGGGFDDVVDRMRKAAQSAASPADFLKNVFAGTPEDMAAADLRPDSEDPSVLNAADPEAAINARDAHFAERAKMYAEELLKNPDISAGTKQRVIDMNGDYSSKANRVFVASNLATHLVGKKITKGINDLGSLADTLAGTVKDAVTGTKKNNLQEIPLAELAPLVEMIASKMGNNAANAPTLARQLLAAANRIPTGAVIDPESDRRLRNLNSVVDDEMLDMVTELSDSEGLREAINKVRSIPSAESDVEKAAGGSFLESMLVDKNTDPQITRGLAKYVDELGLKLKGMNLTQKTNELRGLSVAFGSVKNAQTVAEYYGNLRREAFDKEAGRDELADDRPESDKLALDESSETTDDYEGTADEDFEAARQGLTTREGPPESTYIFQDAKKLRPFRAFESSTLAGGKQRRTAVQEAINLKGKSPGAYVRPVKMSEYVSDTKGDPEAEVKRLAADVKERIAEHEARKGEDRTAQINTLKGELELMRSEYKRGGAKAVLDQYEVLQSSASEQNDTVATDKDLKEYGQLADHGDARDTHIVFQRKDGTKLKLSAESMWGARGKKEGSGKGERADSRAKRLFADAVASVLARPEIEKLVTPLENVTVDRKLGIVAKKKSNPDYVRKVAAALKAARGDLKAFDAALNGTKPSKGTTSKVDGLVDNYIAKENERDALDAFVNDSIADLEKLLDQSREGEGLFAKNLPAQAVAREQVRMLRVAKGKIDEVKFDEQFEERDNNRSGIPGEEMQDIDFAGAYRRLEISRSEIKHAIDVAEDAGDMEAISALDKKLDQNYRQYAELEKREAKNASYRGTGWREREDSGKGPRLVEEDTGLAVGQEKRKLTPSAAERDAAKAKEELTVPKVTLPKTSPYTAKDQAKSDKANKFIGRGSSGSAAADYDKEWAPNFVELSKDTEYAPGWHAVFEDDDDYGQPTARLSDEVYATKAEAAAAGDFGAKFVEAKRATKNSTTKNSFAGNRVDPAMARFAEQALEGGVPVDQVWAQTGWFRGPDGKMRTEIRSPKLEAALRERLTNKATRDKPFKIWDILKDIPAFAAYSKTFLKDVMVTPSNSDSVDSMMMELSGVAGSYNPETKEINLGRAGAILGEIEKRVGAPKFTKRVRALAADSFMLDMGSIIESFIKDGVIDARDVDKLAIEGAISTAMHELQHALQHVDGFENGGNPAMAVIAKYGNPDEYLKAAREEDFGTMDAISEQAFSVMRAEMGPLTEADESTYMHKLYESIIGEVEAADVQSRMDLSDEEAANLKPALADAKREFLRSIAVAEALSLSRASAMNTKKKPNLKTSKKDILAEITRIRGKDVIVQFKKFLEGGASGAYTISNDKIQRLIEISMHAANPMSVAWHESLHDFFAMLDENPTERSIKKDLIDASKAYHVNKQLKKLLEGHPEAIKQLDNDEERVAYMYQFWAEGLLKLGPNTNGIFDRIRKMFRDILKLVGAEDRAADLLGALHEGKFADPSTVSEVLSDLGADRFQNKLNAGAPVLAQALSRVFEAAPDRLRAFHNDKISELADKFSSEKGKTGFIQKRFQQGGVWENKLAGILAGTSASERTTARKNLQAMKAPVSKLEQDLSQFFRDMHDYMTQAGVKTFDSETSTWVPLRQVKDYFPRVFDRAAILGNAYEFTQLLRKHSNMDAKSAGKIVDALTHGTGQLDLVENEHSLGFTPYAQAVQDRKLTFINASNAAEFAKFQSPDLADITTGYVKQAVHRAEYTREFGNDGEKIVELIKASGIKDKKELEDIGKVVQGLEGSLGHEMSSSTKELMSSIMTLQNMVILPMALFSQMIDPVVMAARSGDLKDAGKAYMTAVKRLVGKKVDGEELAATLGIISQDSVLEAMGMAYGATQMSKGMRNINRTFFKYNGLQGWNNSMRIAATAAGERYLIAHKSDEKALSELGLKPADIEVLPSGRLDTSSPELQQAMFRFVDQAVLRPSASNRPVWMSDPRFLLVAHLKQFTFAMHNVVLKRANEQLDDGNPKPWGILLLALPTILAADMAKFALSGNLPDSWGFMDYLNHAVERSGLLGLGDFTVQAQRGVGMGHAPGEQLLGPTFEHLMEVLRWIGGDPRTGAADVIDRTVPGMRFV